MARFLLGAYLCFFLLPAALKSQESRFPSDFRFDRNEAAPAPDPFGGAGGGGQAEPSAWRTARFTRATVGITVSTLGAGLQLGSNLGSRVDLRLFGNYVSIDKDYQDFSRSGFKVNINLQMTNTGAKLDTYPLRRFPLRLSPGFLYFNENRVRADLHAEPNATFTINNIVWTSDNANPVYGTGRLVLGGTGFMMTTGVGHIVSHERRRFTFPFELGAAFIHSPTASLNLFGNICQADGTQCQPAATFPTFASNLAAQMATWNHDAQPFHIYPIVEIGVAYTVRTGR